MFVDLCDNIVGVLEPNFIQPTHNKQDFEKTSLFHKLEDRLKQMTVEYWCDINRIFLSSVNIVRLKFVLLQL